MHPLVARPAVAGLHALLVGGLIALALAACSGDAGSRTFDPKASCTVDQRLPGAYPALEALVPAALDGRAPDRLDSGRNCSDANLSTLLGHGIEEIRFAGGLWQESATSGMTLAVFTAEGLTAAMMSEWYEAGARAARKTERIETSQPTIGGHEGFRLDALNGESLQTVVVWPSPAADDVVRVVIAADMPEERIQAAVAAFR